MGGKVDLEPLCQRGADVGVVGVAREVGEHRLHGVDRRRTACGGLDGLRLPGVLDAVEDDAPGVLRSLQHEDRRRTDH